MRMKRFPYPHPIDRDWLQQIQPKALKWSSKIQEEKSKQQPRGGVPKAAKRMGQDSGSRLRLQTDDEKKRAVMVATAEGGRK